MNAGRPPKYKTPVEMQRIIDLYFIACNVRSTGNTDHMEGLPEEDLLIINDIEGNAPTVCGLAYNLGMSRQALLNYQGKPEFKNTIERAKLRVEIYLEESLRSNSCTGSIFNLKNNFGWKDKTQQELTGKDDGPIKSESTVEAGPGIQGVMDAIKSASSGRQDNSIKGSNTE